ncbi:glycosyltransferase family 4 protein [Bacteroides fragilis]|uniref:glycosyltransferase family 4 protein n=1 Tax=Bacteroides fragilis TaxID=817 RepID=UPI00202E34B3|nr:glycosyltransferase family 4 protein [Bacteroides fragilis]MCM0207552.1 glycosyltransferase family 4 protein [Bacteroides fragilis]
MKVIHILNELKFSGAEIMYVDAASVFQYLNCELSVVNTDASLGEYAPYFKKIGYKVFHKPCPKGIIQKIKYYTEFTSFLKKENYDIVHIHRSDMKWTMSYCAKKAGCKAIYTFHNVFKSHWYSYPLHWWLRWSAKNIFKCTFQTISDSVYNNEKSYYHNKTIKIYNWYGNNRFFPAKEGEKEEVRKQLDIAPNALVLISVGGCSTIKRHTDIIKALPEIIQKFPDTVYLHLGDGKTLKEEKELAQQLDVSSHIRFCGNQSDIRKYLIASDIYLMTSKFEGISLTTIEAMACRIPTILYDVPGLHDFNQEQECSILIKEDYHLLAQTVLSLFNDPAKRQNITDNGVKLVHRKYDMQTNATEIFKLYTKRK